MSFDDYSWNDRRKNPPPDEVQPPGSRLDLNLLESSLSKLNKDLQDDFKLAESAALLSRVMARRAHSFRGQKMFQCLKKIRTSLCRYHEVNILNRTTRINGLFSHNSVPVRHCFGYFLMRLQITVKILLRTYLCCNQASKICFQLMKMNHFMDINVLIISILSEITSLCHAIMKAIKTFIDISLPLKDNLPKSLVEKCADDGYRDILINDQDALESIFSKRSRPIIPKPLNVVKSLMDFSDEEADEHSLIPKICNPEVDVPSTMKKQKIIDIGEAVSRSSFMTENKKRKK